MNRITLSGRLVRDPEEGYTQNNKNWTKFCIAVKRPFTKDICDFFDCMSYGTTATYVSKYLRKGDYAIVAGSAGINTYQEKKYVSIAVDNIEKVSNKKDGNDTDAAVRELNKNGAFEDLPSDELSDDELPF